MSRADGCRLRALSNAVALCLLLSTVAACSGSAGDSSTPAALADVPSVQCVPRGLQAEGLGMEWQPFAAHIHACVIVTPAGVPALELIGVSAESYNAQASAARGVVLPRPLLLRPGGEVMGRLPYNFPDDPQWRTKLRFKDWHQEIPWRIEMHIQGATLDEDKQIVLIWNAADRTYVEANAGTMIIGIVDSPRTGSVDWPRTP